MADTLNPVTDHAQYNASLPTATDGKLIALQADVNGRLLTSSGSGTAGTPSGGVQSVQGVSGGTPVAAKNSIVTITVTPTINTAGAYAAGNLLFDCTAIASAVLANGDGCFIDSITLIDKDGQNVAADLIISQGNTTMGSLRATPTISAANYLANVPIRAVQVGTGDYSTVKSGLTTATVSVGRSFQAGGSSTGLYIAGIAQSAGTYTNAANLVLEITVIR